MVRGGIQQSEYIDGELIHLFAREAIDFGRVLSGLDHGEDRGVVEDFIREGHGEVLEVVCGQVALLAGASVTGACVGGSTSDACAALTSVHFFFSVFSGGADAEMADVAAGPAARVVAAGNAPPA